jgi:oxalate decarboxylase
MNETTQDQRITRRGLLHAGSAALAGVAALTGASGQDTGDPSRDSSYERKTERSPDHHLKNETVPGPKYPVLAAENPNSAWAPETDNGTVPPFKYSFALAHKRIDTGGWTRQVTVRELPIAKTLSGVEMRLTAGGVRESCIGIFRRSGQLCFTVTRASPPWTNRAEALSMT